MKSIRKETIAICVEVVAQQAPAWTEENTKILSCGSLVLSPRFEYVDCSVRNRSAVTQSDRSLCANTIVVREEA
jgi:hypothetical protein